MTHNETCHVNTRDLINKLVNLFVKIFSDIKSKVDS